MWKSFFGKRTSRESPHAAWWRMLRAYGGAVILVFALIAQVKLALLFNVWNATFLDTLAHATSKPAIMLWQSVAIFAGIAIGDIVVHTMTGYAKRIYSLWWREAITEKYVPAWQNKPDTSVYVEGISQRIQEGTGEYARIIENLGWEFLRSIFILIAFIPLLWYMSTLLTTGPLAWPGSFAAIAFAASIGGMIISWFVGRHLPNLETESQKAEAAFRKCMVMGEDSRVVLKTLGWRRFFADVTSNYRRLYLHYGYFDGWGLTYAKVVMLVPYVICIPHMPSGVISFAAMLMIVNAFGEVQAGFSVVLRNWTQVTRLRSVHRLSLIHI